MGGWASGGAGGWICSKRTQELAAASLWTLLSADPRGVEVLCRARGAAGRLAAAAAPSPAQISGPGLALVAGGGGGSSSVAGGTDLRKWAVAALSLACGDARVQEVCEL